MMRDTLVTALDAAVPLHILEMRSWTDEAILAVGPSAATIIGTHGDALQYGGKHCAEAFNALARGLAALAHFVGGVEFFGHHYEADTPRFGAPQDLQSARAGRSSTATTERN